jgi:hypothetical protein
MARRNAFLSVPAPAPGDVVLTAAAEDGAVAHIAVPMAMLTGQEMGKIPRLFEEAWEQVRKAKR